LEEYKTLDIDEKIIEIADFLGDFSWGRGYDSGYKIGLRDGLKESTECNKEQE